MTIATAGGSQPSISPLPNEPRIRSAEDARLLIAKRGRALDSLELSEEDTRTVEEELRALGWPTDLASNTPRLRSIRNTHDSWPENDVRALLCFNRHTKTPDKILRGNFFWSRGASESVLRNKRMQMLTKEVAGWEAKNDAELRRLYKRDAKTFDSIAGEKIFDTEDHSFSALDLEIAYAKTSNPESKMKKREYQPKRGGNRKGSKGKGKKARSRTQAAKMDASESEGDESSGGEEMEDEDM